MVNSRASGKRIVIENYKEASATNDSKVFTFPAIDFDTVAYLELQYDLGVSAALNIELIINAIATGYYRDGMHVLSGTMTVIDDSNLAHLVIASTLIVSANNHGGCGMVRIYLKKTASNNYGHFICEAVGTQNDFEIYGGLVATDIQGMTSITITTSASTWLLDSRFTLYKVLR